MGGPERDQVTMWGGGDGAREGPEILVLECICFRLIVLYHTHCCLMASSFLYRIYTKIIN